MVVIYLLVSNFIKVIISEADYFEDMCKELEAIRAYQPTDAAIVVVYLNMALIQLSLMMTMGNQ